MTGVAELTWLGASGTWEKSMLASAEHSNTGAPAGVTGAATAAPPVRPSASSATSNTTQPTPARSAV
jgi:hypothetical protein